MWLIRIVSSNKQPIGTACKTRCIKHHSIMLIKSGIGWRPHNQFWGLHDRVERVQIEIRIQACRCMDSSMIIHVSYTSREYNLMIICMDSSMIIHVWGSIVIHRLREKKEVFSNPLYNSAILTTFCTKGLYGKHNKLTYRW